MPLIVETDRYTKDREKALLVLKRLHKIAKGSQFDEAVKDKIKRYYASTDLSKGTLDGLIELQNIVAKNLNIDSEYVLSVVMDTLFESAHSQIAKRSDYSEEQKGEVIARIVLFLVKEENEKLVKKIGKEWKTYLLKYSN